MIWPVLEITSLKVKFNSIMYFRNSVINNISVMYGIGIIMTGILVYTFNLLGKKSKEGLQHWSEIYNLFLSTIGIACTSWFLYDINDYFSWLKDHTKKVGYSSFSERKERKKYKHYGNGVILTMQNLSSKCCQSLGQIICQQRRFRSF